MSDFRVDTREYYFSDDTIPLFDGYSENENPVWEDISPNPLYLTVDDEEKETLMEKEHHSHTAVVGEKNYVPEEEPMFKDTFENITVSAMGKENLPMTTNFPPSNFVQKTFGNGNGNVYFEPVMKLPRKKEAMKIVKIKKEVPFMSSHRMNGRMNGIISPNVLLGDGHRRPSRNFNRNFYRGNKTRQYPTPPRILTNVEGFYSVPLNPPPPVFVQNQPRRIKQPFFTMQHYPPGGYDVPYSTPNPSPSPTGRTNRRIVLKKMGPSEFLPAPPQPQPQPQPPQLPMVMKKVKKEPVVMENISGDVYLIRPMRSLNTVAAERFPSYTSSLPYKYNVYIRSQKFAVPKVEFSLQRSEKVKKNINCGEKQFERLTRHMKFKDFNVDGLTQEFKRTDTVDIGYVHVYEVQLLPQSLKTKRVYRFVSKEISSGDVVYQSNPFIIYVRKNEKEYAFWDNYKVGDRKSKRRKVRKSKKKKKTKKRRGGDGDDSDYYEPPSKKMVEISDSEEDDENQSSGEEYSQETRGNTRKRTRRVRTRKSSRRRFN